MNPSSPGALSFSICLTVSSTSSSSIGFNNKSLWYSVMTWGMCLRPSLWEASLSLVRSSRRWKKMSSGWVLDVHGFRQCDLLQFSVWADHCFNGRGRLFVEETSISFSFLEPFHTGFLVPNYLLMMFSFTEFLDQGSFLIPNIYRETWLQPFGLNLFYFVVQLCFCLEHVPKRFFVPFLDFSFKDFNILSELVHPCSCNGWYFLPPFF